MTIEFSPKTAVGFRSFRKPQPDGSLSEKDLNDVTLKRDVIKNFVDGLSPLLPIEPIIITTSDLPVSGRTIFEASGFKIVYADTLSTKISQANMLNAFMENLGLETKNCVILSPSLLGIHRDQAINQVMGLANIYDMWEKQRPNKLTTAGSIIEGEHDPELVKGAIDGTEDLSLSNIWRIFPTNAMSLVLPEARFSKMTDNGRLGTIQVEGQEEKIGGNEDLFYSVGRMLRGNDCIVLVDPVMPGERQAKVETVGKRVARRQKVNEIYTRILIAQFLNERRFRELTQHIDSKIVPAIDGRGIEYTDEMKRAIELYFNKVIDPASFTTEEVSQRFERMVDQHLFFAKQTTDNKIEIMLTKRQRNLIPSF